ncbi:hypothetical protein CI238_10011, partial [Colletotrichum incanum]
LVSWPPTRGWIFDPSVLVGSLTRHGTVEKGFKATQCNPAIATNKPLPKRFCQDHLRSGPENCSDGYGEGGIRKGASHQGIPRASLCFKDKGGCLSFVFAVDEKCLQLVLGRFFGDGIVQQWMRLRINFVVQFLGVVQGTNMREESTLSSRATRTTNKAKPAGIYVVLNAKPQVKIFGLSSRCSLCLGLSWYEV